MNKKQLVPRKHIGKSMTAKQEMMVEQIQKDLSLRTMAEAKHEYFENQEKYDKRQGTKIVPIPGTPEEAEQPNKKSVMTIAETKLGVTLVLNKDECKQLGIQETKTTKEAIQQIRAKLGLPEKKKRNKK